MGRQEGDAHGSPRAGGFNPLRESSGFLSPLGGVALPAGFLFYSRNWGAEGGNGGENGAILMHFPGRPSTRMVWGHPFSSGNGESLERRRTGKRGATTRRTNFPHPAIPLPNFRRFMDVSGKLSRGFASSSPLPKFPHSPSTFRGVLYTREKSLCVF